MIEIHAFSECYTVRVFYKVLSWGDTKESSLYDLDVQRDATWYFHSKEKELWAVSKSIQRRHFWICHSGCFMSKLSIRSRHKQKTRLIELHWFYSAFSPNSGKTNRQRHYFIRYVKLWKRYSSLLDKEVSVVWLNFFVKDVTKFCWSHRKLCRSLYCSRKRVAVDMFPKHLGLRNLK